jgi:hypothetical protein
MSRHLSFLAGSLIAVARCRPTRFPPSARRAEGMSLAWLVLGASTVLTDWSDGPCRTRVLGTSSSPRSSETMDDTLIASGRAK